MAIQGRIAVIFPGQGVLDMGALEKYQSTCPELVSMLADVDRVGRRLGQASLTDTLSELGGGPPAVALLIYVASVAAYRRLERLGAGPHALLGHGFGEIAALVAGGAFSLSDGAEIVVQRFMCLSTAPREAMASIEAPAATAAALIQLVQDGPVSIAAENSSRETLLVGSERALATIASLARTLGISVRRLKTVSSPHRPAIGAVEAAIVDSLRHIRQRPLARAVFSPLKQRFYRDTDHLVDCLAKQLVEPLRFADAIRQLVQNDIALVVECGPLHGLASKLDCAAMTDDELARDLPTGSVRSGFEPAAVRSRVAQAVAL